jgi:phospholipid/cholesterol/gamma-HCH transport system permease protein
VERAGDSARVWLTGRLDATTVASVWPRVIGPLRAAPAPRISVDASGLSYCDGAGMGLLVEIGRIARAASGRAVFEGLAPDLGSLLDRATPADAPAAGPSKPSLIEQIGRSTAAVLSDLYVLVAFLGEITAAFLWAIRHPGRIRWRDAAVIAEKAGANAVPVVSLLGCLMGVIISFQTAAPLQRLGVESEIPTMLAIAMVRELGPLITAIILAGRSGSAFAAEIGTMKVTEEINALTTFGLDPVRFLVIPRLIAAMFMTPLLSLFGTLFGLAGGYLIMLTLGFGLSFYINQVQTAVDYIDLLQGVFKSIVFAFLVAAIGCVKGLQTRSGPGAVGDSTTGAVVMGIVLIVATDGLLGVVFYFIGI